MLDTYLSTKADYDNIAAKYLSGSEYGFRGGIVNYNTDRNEFIVSACLDAEGLARLLTGKLLGGQRIPDAAQTAIKIATTFFKFLHFQITAVVSDKEEYTASETADVIALLNNVPGMKSDFMTNLKQDGTSCPNGGSFPSF